MISAKTMKTDRVLECFICHRTITGNKISNLRRHVRLHDSTIDCFKCLECLSTFQTRSNFKQHWFRQHQHLTEPRMVPTSRVGKPLRVVEVAERKATVNRMNPLTNKISQPMFGDTPVFHNSFSLQPNTKCTRSIFGHIAFGSNLPSFDKVCAVPIETVPSIDTLSVKKSFLLTNEVPDILKTVGLCRIQYSPPKCYGKKRFTTIDKSAVTLSQIDQSIFDLNFGKLDWEQIWMGTNLWPITIVAYFFPLIVQWIITVNFLLNRLNFLWNKNEFTLCKFGCYCYFLIVFYRSKMKRNFTPDQWSWMKWLNSSNWRTNKDELSSCIFCFAWIEISFFSVLFVQIQNIYWFGNTLKINLRGSHCHLRWQLSLHIIFFNSSQKSYKIITVLTVFVMDST